MLRDYGIENKVTVRVVYQAVLVPHRAVVADSLAYRFIAAVIQHFEADF